MRVGNFARVVKHGQTRRYEAMVGVLARAGRVQMEQPYSGPVCIDVRVIFKRPKRLMRAKDPDRYLWGPKKPDLSNVVKAVEDGITTAGIWDDDDQVCKMGEVVKLYATKSDNRARVEVVVWKLPEYPGVAE